MFKENPAKGADVFYMRHILHDWPDTHAVLISKALFPSLKNGARFSSPVFKIRRLMWAKALLILSRTFAADVRSLKLF